MTHFEAEHRFAAEPDGVVRVLADPDFYRELELPDLALLDAGSQRGPDNMAAVMLRYEFTGDLHPMAKQLLGGGRLTWVQTLRLEPTGRAGSLSFEVEAKPEVLHGEASFILGTLEPGPGPGGVGTVRRLEGEITVALPIVGGMAERGIAAGIVARLDVEADALRRRLS